MNYRLEEYVEHAGSIGRVVISWNEVHWVVYRLFVAFSGMPEKRARDVFFALRSESSQRELTLAAGKTALASVPELWEKFRSTIGEINKLAGERNAAVHTMWGFNFYEALTGQTEVSFGPMEGAARHGSLKADFLAQCTVLRNELQNHFSSLITVMQQFSRLTSSASEGGNEVVKGVDHP